jgi:RNA polymerase sigma factor (sigma-70 family)
MLGSHDEAEDAVQHTFAAAFRDLQRRQDRELALKPWLYAIARNRCISMLRARRDHVADSVERASHHAGLAEEVERRAELRDLLDDLRELPEDQRAALLLAEVGDLSHADVAGVLGCEVHKVKALVFRARSGLIQRRKARETPCAEIREQLANLRGGSLRRSELRHHLRECVDCRTYREQVKQQRRMLAAALPVVPSLGLKSSVLAAIGVGGGSVGGGVAAGLGGIGAALSAPLGAGTLVKVAAVGMLVGGGAVAGRAALDESTPGPVQRAPAPAGAVAPADGVAGAGSHPMSAPGAGRRDADRRTGVRKDGKPAGRGDEQRAARAEERRAGARGTEKRAARAEERRAGARGAEKRAARAEERRAGARGAEKRAARGEERARARGHDKNAVPPGQARGHVGRKPAHEKGAVKAKPQSSGRGPVAAPPSDPPVKRGPPKSATPSAELPLHPKPKAKADARLPVTARDALPAPAKAPKK